MNYVDKDSFMHRLDPRVKVIVLVFFTVIVFLITRPVLIVIMFLSFLSVWTIVERLPSAGLIKTAKFVAGLMGFIILLQAIFYTGNTYILGPVPKDVWLIGGMGIKWEGIAFGLLLAVRLMALIVLMPMVLMTTPIHLFSLGLIRMGLPYKIAYMTTTSMNLVPTFESELGVIMDAQKMRGMTIFEEKGKRFRKMKAWVVLVVPLVIGAMRRAQMMGMAMDARAFGAFKTRTCIDSIRMRWSDWLTLILCLAYGAALVVLNWILR